MPIIFLVAALAVYGAANVHDTTTKDKQPFTSNELDDMLGEMIGKSKRECRKILRKYRK